MSILLTPSLRVTVMRRHGLLFDTRFIPPANERVDGAMVYLVLEGAIEFSDEGRAPAGPIALAFPESEFEGSLGRRSVDLRLYGRPYVAIELRFERAPQRKRSRRIELEDRAWAVANELAAALETGTDDRLAIALDRVLDALVEAGALEERPAVRPEGETPFRPLWGALASFITRFDVLPTLDQVSVLSGTSPRQLARTTSAFIGAFGLRGASWREATHRLRIKTAVLALSADEATVTEVARVAGYSGPAAMARAFRDASLPAPREIQGRLRDTRRGLDA